MFIIVGNENFHYGIPIGISKSKKEAEAELEALKVAEIEKLEKWKSAVNSWKE